VENYDESRNPWLVGFWVEMWGMAGIACVIVRGLTFERVEPHNFARGSSNMVGSLLEIRLGVRCLSVEAGWARTPSDGIMRHGALAFARITHFGMPKQDSEFRLVHAETLPYWLANDDSVIDSSHLSGHFDTFIAT